MQSVETTVELPRSQTLRVLIVEDEPRLRDLLLGAVPEMGFPAAAARTAEDGLKMMRADPHDIVLLDLQLPLMSGMEFFEQVRNEWPATQVIILTGFGDLASARRAIQLEVVEFLSKPCHLHEIESAPSRARSRIMAREAHTAAAISEMRRGRTFRRLPSPNISRSSRPCAAAAAIARRRRWNWASAVGRCIIVWWSIKRRGWRSNNCVASGIDARPKTRPGHVAGCCRPVTLS